MSTTIDQELVEKTRRRVMTLLVTDDHEAIDLFVTGDVSPNLARAIFGSILSVKAVKSAAMENDQCTGRRYIVRFEDVVNDVERWINLVFLIKAKIALILMRAEQNAAPA